MMEVPFAQLVKMEWTNTKAWIVVSSFILIILGSISLTLDSDEFVITLNDGTLKAKYSDGHFKIYEGRYVAFDDYINIYYWNGHGYISMYKARGIKYSNLSYYTEGDTTFVKQTILYSKGNLTRYFEITEYRVKESFEWNPIDENLRTYFLWTYDKLDELDEKQVYFDKSIKGTKAVMDFNITNNWEREIDNIVRVERFQNGKLKIRTRVFEGQAIFDPEIVLKEEEKDTKTPIWTSPADWLYVRENNGTIETVYGNFYFNDSGVNMIKDGEHLGTMKVGKVVELPQIKLNKTIVCNETTKECLVTLDYGLGKMFILFDQFEATIEYEYINKDKVAKTENFYFELETGSKIKNEGNNTRKFENDMIFNYMDIVNQTGVRNVSFKDGKFRIETKNITLQINEKVLLDPTWTTPSSVHSSFTYYDYDCGTTLAWTNPSNAVDDDTGTDAYTSYTIFDCGPPSHYIIFDLGSSKTVGDVRVYVPQYNQAIYDVYVSDSTSSWGSSKGTVGISPNMGSSAWFETDITDTSGRYIVLESSESTEFRTEIYEFDYAEGAAADSTPPTYSNNSTNSTLANTSILHSLQWADDTALSGYIFSFDNGSGTLNNDSWVAMSGTGNWSNVSKLVNSSVGAVIQWCVYANDTTNNWNGSSCTMPFNYTTTSAPSDSCDCPGAATNWELDMEDYCQITSNCNISSGILNYTGDYGWANLSATIICNESMGKPPSNTTLWMHGSGAHIVLT